MTRRFERGSKRQICLYLPVDLLDGMDKVASAENMSISGFVETNLTSIVNTKLKIQETAEPVEPIEEPDVQLGLPRMIAEIRDQYDYAEQKLFLYLQFAEQKHPEKLDAFQGDKVCQLIAMAAFYRFDKFGLDPLSFLAEQANLLNKYVWIGLPDIKKKLARLVKNIETLRDIELVQIQNERNAPIIAAARVRLEEEKKQNQIAEVEGMQKAIDATWAVAQDGIIPIPTAEGHWSQIEAVLDPDLFPMTDDDIVQALGDEISANIINALMTEHGYIGKEREDGFIEYSVSPNPA